LSRRWANKLQVGSQRQALAGGVGGGLLQRQRQPPECLGELGGCLPVGVAGAAYQQLDRVLERQQVDRDRVGDTLPGRVPRGHQHMPTTSTRQEL
jgi:hypothetical protein